MSDTGLPALPKGYFWRFKKWNYKASTNTISVQICRRWLGLVFVYESSIANHKDWRDIQRSCGFALAKLHDDPDKFDGIKEVVGNYPPKSLPSGVGKP